MSYRQRHHATNSGYDLEFSFGGVPAPDRDLELRIIALLREHGPREGEALAAYEQLVEQTDHGAVLYLMRLILEDERRHHQVIEEMLHDVESFVWEMDVEPRTPAASHRPDKETHAATRRLLDLERDDKRELRKLKKELSQNKAWSIHALLVDMMLQDTSKHIRILEYIRKMTKP